MIRKTFFGMGLMLFASSVAVANDDLTIEFFPIEPEIQEIILRGTPAESQCLRDIITAAESIYNDKDFRDQVQTIKPDQGKVLILINRHKSYQPSYSGGGGFFITDGSYDMSLITDQHQYDTYRNRTLFRPTYQEPDRCGPRLRLQANALIHDALADTIAHEKEVQAQKDLDALVQKFKEITDRLKQQDPPSGAKVATGQKKVEAQKIESAGDANSLNNALIAR